MNRSEYNLDLKLFGVLVCVRVLDVWAICLDYVRYDRRGVWGVGWT